MKKLKIDSSKLQLRKATLTFLSKSEMNRLVGGQDQTGFTADGSPGCLSDGCMPFTDIYICPPPSNVSCGCTAAGCA